MKKIVFSLMAATLCLLMTSCGSPASRLQSLADDIEKNGNDWTDADKWESVMEDLLTMTCDFLESNFNEDEVMEFGESLTNLVDALRGIDDNKALKAIKKAQKAMSKKKDLQKRLKSAQKKADKHSKDLDLDEDELREAFSGLYYL